jgi:hypothetical protein
MFFLRQYYTIVPVIERNCMYEMCNIFSSSILYHCSGHREKVYVWDVQCIFFINIIPLYEMCNGFFFVNIIPLYEMCNVFFFVNIIPLYEMCNVFSSSILYHCMRCAMFFSSSILYHCSGHKEKVYVWDVLCFFFINIIPLSWSV